MKRINIVLIALCILGSSCSTNTGKNKDSKAKNVLFIAVDDLRLQAGIYGQANMVTPNLDRLGNNGLVFNRAYCSVPVCGASRASLLTGVRPTPNRFVNYYTRKDKDLPGMPSLPKWFKGHGYTTISNGKVYHHNDDDLTAWTEKPYLPQPGIGWQSYLTEESEKIINENKTQENPDAIIGPAYECADVADNAYPDGMIADKSIEDLKKLKEQGKPFFLAVGFLKPHLPFNAPKKYWELYDENRIELADNPFKPINAPDEAMHPWGELRNMYDDIPKEGNIPDDKARKLIHGYYACVSYTDAQIGKLLDALDNFGLIENTIIVLWGDHGWHLGEHTLWCKHCNFNRVMNAPLIVSAPEKVKGEKTSSITEFIDIYPTLCELCELPVPDHLDGTSFMPVLENPSAKVKDAAFVKYHNAETVITEHYTYTEFLNESGDGEKYRMLYDLVNDPAENVNISEDEQSVGLINKFSDLLSTVKQSKN